jgi:hypothetical protein
MHVCIHDTASLLTGCGDTRNEPQSQVVVEATPTCGQESLPVLPDVRITSATQEVAPASHCKVVGVIGAETNFDLHMPDTWNGKFVMGGGGSVGVAANVALAYGALQKGYATVGTDTGHSATRPITALSDW